MGYWGWRRISQGQSGGTGQGQRDVWRAPKWPIMVITRSIMIQMVIVSLLLPYSDHDKRATRNGTTFGNIDIISTSFTKSANNAAGQTQIESSQNVECNAGSDNDRRRGANVDLIGLPAINDWGYQR